MPGPARRWLSRRGDVSLTALCSLGYDAVMDAVVAKRMQREVCWLCYDSLQGIKFGPSGLFSARSD